MAMTISILKWKRLSIENRLKILHGISKILPAMLLLAGCLTDPPSVSSTPSASAYTVTVTLVGSGTVSASGLTCSAGTCAVSYPGNATTVFTVTPADGWTFIGWEGACSGTTACSLSVTADLSITAVFGVLPPTSPTGLAATTVNWHRIDLVWGPSGSGAAIAGYRVYRDGLLAATVISTAYSDTRLADATPYRYSVEAVDILGNVSPQTKPVVGTTDPFEMKSTSEVSLIEELPCIQDTEDMGYFCSVFKAVVDADDPSTPLDDALQPVNLLLAVRKKPEALWVNRWIVFEAGGNGRGYGPAFGGVPPGTYVPAGDGYGDDLIRWYNESDYVTVDVVWECGEAETEPCYNTPFVGWVPEYTGGTGWFRNTGGAGYGGAGSRTRAVIEWMIANNGGYSVGAHGQSSGTGRLMTALTRYQAESLMDTVVFDGGPVMAYIPWYCGMTDDGDPSNGTATPGPLGPKPPAFDIEAYLDETGFSGFRNNYDDARDLNNGEGSNPYRNCTNSVWDPLPMLDDSNFYMATDRDFERVDIAVVLGGHDATPASAHARLWFHGYSYGAESVPALSAESVTIRQGYCSTTADSAVLYSANNNDHPCTDWDASQFPTATEVAYVPELASVGHTTAQSLSGATELFRIMLATCEAVPLP
jgi:hypothetical protein